MLRRREAIARRVSLAGPRSHQAGGMDRSVLKKQAEQLGISLPAVSEPFSGAYWAGEEKYLYPGAGMDLAAGQPIRDQSWWPYEQKGYWIDGSLRCALALGDEKLLNAAKIPIEYTLSHAAPEGYLGPASIKEPLGNFHRWPHAIFFRALAAYSAANNDASVVEAVRKHYLSDAADYGVPRVERHEHRGHALGHTSVAETSDCSHSPKRPGPSISNTAGKGSTGMWNLHGCSPMRRSNLTASPTARFPSSQPSSTWRQATWST